MQQHELRVPEGGCLVSKGAFGLKDFIVSGSPARERSVKSSNHITQIQNGLHRQGPLTS